MVKGEIYNIDKDTFRKNPEYRDHGSYRRRKDYNHGENPLLFRGFLQNGRGPRGDCCDGLDDSRAGARNHYYFGGYDMLLERSQDKHHRYPGTCRFYNRGGKISEGSGWGYRHLRFCSRGRTTVRDGLEAG